MRNDIEVGRPRTSGLVEVLDRVLDKGLFIGGDVKISLAEVELLTIRIRLIVCSLDKAREIGLDWWTYDRHLAPGKVAAADRDALEARLAAIEELLAAMPKAGRGRAANGRAGSARAAPLGATSLGVGSRGVDKAKSGRGATVAGAGAAKAAKTARPAATTPSRGRTRKSTSRRS
jgi:hypothetical protein